MAWFAMSVVSFPGLVISMGVSCGGLDILGFAPKGRGGGGGAKLLLRAGLVVACTSDWLLRLPKVGL